MTVFVCFIRVFLFLFVQFTDEDDACLLDCDSGVSHQCRMFRRNFVLVIPFHNIFKRKRDKGKTKIE